MPFDYETGAECIQEINRELLRIGRDRCNHLRDETQLSAVILLLLRTTSLFRSMVRLLQAEELDAFDAVRRAFFEAWNLAFQFRLTAFCEDVTRWQAQENQAWSARLGDLERYARERGHRTPNLGRDYGMLSRLAHPTRDAAENSAALQISRYANNPQVHTIERAREHLENGLNGILYRIVWLTIDQHEDFIDIPVNEGHLRTAAQYAENYEDIARE